MQIETQGGDQGEAGEVVFWLLKVEKGAESAAKKHEEVERAEKFTHR